MAHQQIDPETFGPFRLYGRPGEAWALSWNGEWLPGVYVDREALMFVCGLFLGSENNGLVDEYLEMLQNRLGSEPLTAEQVRKHWHHNNS
jgi:hypothetical protein